ncbi:DUF4221 family protein [Thermoflexibacter ruber]|uniref:DUF4221 domain-containing protein n=1 Tax=Thermoflexibacter ruber TaxID=1003 RepID=A0A1I2FUQ6_9BACT|nr:DUF4221 family protein [Thermoflexibacter ruber]SFF09164.1 protein of unknown function [Thermoflexibacter ruber]
MKNFFIFVFVSFLVSLLSCSYKEEDTSEIQQEEKGGLILSYDSIAISIDSSYLRFYNPHSFLKIKDTLLYYGYNHHNHSIDLFSLSNISIIKKINLDKEGPNGVAEAHSLFVSSPDSLFISNENESTLYLVSGKGKVLKKWALWKILPQKFYEKNRYSATLEYPLIYDKHQNTVYIRLFDYEYGSKNPDYQKGFQKAILGKLNLSNSQFTILPVFYPEDIQKNYKGYLQHMMCIFPLLDEENRLQKLFFTFAASPNISYYDVQKQQYIISDGKSTLTENEIENLSWADRRDEDKKMQHFVKQVNFMFTAFDASCNRGYRFHLGKLPEGITDMRNSVLKQKLVLTIFNENLKIMKEVDFAAHRNVGLRFFYPFNGKLYIPCFDEKREDLLKFLIVQFNEKDLQK